MILPRLRPENLVAPCRRTPPPAILRGAREIVEDVRERGLAAVEEHAERLDGAPPDAKRIFDSNDLRRELEDAPPESRRRLERVAGRIRRFARAQRAALEDFTIRFPGGRAGQRFSPVRRAGGYAPGGRYPLPSSVLMTAVTARAAGVESVWLASPRPAPITRWAAAVAGADGLLAAGGAQAIAALAFGAGPVPPSDVVAGPGNLWVTAAKHIVSSEVTIDLPAGPSELVVIADSSARPELVAADLLAQAEHDVDALVLLLSTEEDLLAAVDRELVAQLAKLPTAETARESLRRGGAVLCADLEEAVRLSDAVAPEHLQLAVRDPESLGRRPCDYGALFLGHQATTVLGDYGAGPNHVLPTAGAARRSGGLSVLSFLRVRTWIDASGLEEDRELVEDVVWLARQEGLEGHARSAEQRLKATLP